MAVGLGTVAGDHVLNHAEVEPKPGLEHVQTLHLKATVQNVLEALHKPRTATLMLVQVRIL